MVAWRKLFQDWMKAIFPGIFLDYEINLGEANYMDLNTLLTIVIPTYNRYNYLLRLLKYYEAHDFPAKILILDSSSNNHGKSDLLSRLNNTRVKRIKFSHVIRYHVKLFQGIQDISTPYGVFCADDDFITPMGLEKSIDFLECNKDYVVAHGRYVVFNQSEANPDIIEWKSVYGDNSIESIDCGKRLLSHLSNYRTPTFYGVHRTDILKSIWKASREYTDDYRFCELLPTALTAVYGKIKVLDCLYSAREYDGSSTGQSCSTLSDFIVEGSFDGKYERFKKCLAGELREQAGLRYGESEKLVDRAMNGYLKKSSGLSMNALRFKLMLKKSVIGKVVNSTGLLSAYRKLKTKLKHGSSRPVVQSSTPYEDTTHPCYSAFSRIREAINSGV